MIKVKAKSFLGDVDISSANTGSQGAAVKLTLQLNLAKSVLKAKKDILEAKKGIAKHFKKKLQSS